ncbi:Testican-2 [Ilyodon furcidens]|uniref:Testican-2 n=1 Tax=Ilyodon furcidens TaxID=33524 RepID=A0ABV0T6P2_9TELE
MRKVKLWKHYCSHLISCFSPDVDTTKDPCQKVKCSRHKVCIAQGYQRAVCVNRKKIEHRLKQPTLRSPDGNCQPCPISSTGPVCGSDGHNYASKVCFPVVRGAVRMNTVEAHTTKPATH